MSDSRPRHKLQRPSKPSNCLLALVLFCATLSGCAGSIRPEKTVSGSAGNSRGEWRGQAYIQNLRDGKSGTLDLEILAQEPSKLRVEAVGSFDVPVASLVLNGGEVRFLLPREKKFITAPAASDTLSRLISVSISADDLMSLLFDRGLDSKNWKCVANGPQSGSISDCKKNDGTVSIHWDRTDPVERKLKFTSNVAVMDLHLTEAKAKVEYDDSAFTLKAPNGYIQETYPQH
jgi:outer membrane lipoprotein-sorting protein